MIASVALVLDVIYPLATLHHILVTIPHSTVRYITVEVQAQSLPLKEEIKATTTQAEQPKKNTYTAEACSCILYVQNKGIALKGDADQQKPNLFGEEPKRGDVVILRYKSESHVAYIEGVFSGGIYISESNYKPCKKTERLLAWNDQNIVGFIRESI